MKIIVEGADGVGKTTIVNYLAEKFNLTKRHITSQDLNTFLFYYNLLEDNDNVIFDRHFIGEMIYPYLFNRKGNLTNEQFDILLNKALTEDTYIFIITADNDIIKQRLLERGDEPEEVIKTFEYANIAFKAISRRHYIPMFESNNEKVFEDIMRYFDV
jgi:thymidylate kinase